MKTEASTPDSRERPALPAIFSEVAYQYARYRPRYPRALFAYLSMLCPRTALAWDCATGNGQAALGLAAHFDRVVATDASPDQLRKAPLHPRVHYGLARSESSGLETGSVDLVTVAQAAHWFDLTAFYRETHRVLRPQGLLSVWTYHLPSISPSVDAVLNRYFYEVVGPYAPPELEHVNSGYRTLPFPDDELASRNFEISTYGTLHDLVGFLNSFSAAVLFQRAEGYSPVDAIHAELRVAWGAPDRRLLWYWQFAMRVARWGPAMLTVGRSP